MKTKATLFRLLAGIMVITFVNLNGLSQENICAETGYYLPMYYSYQYNYTVTYDEEILLESWMVCDLALETADDASLYLESWMFDFNSIDILADETIDIAAWMYGENEMAEAKNMEMMQWMFDFEPFVIDEILHSNESINVEQWMLELEPYNELPIFDTFVELQDWMIGKDLGFIEPSIIIENWMINLLAGN